MLIDCSLSNEQTSILSQMSNITSLFIQYSECHINQLLSSYAKLCNLHLVVDNNFAIDLSGLPALQNLFTNCVAHHSNMNHNDCVVESENVLSEDDIVKQLKQQAIDAGVSYEYYLQHNCQSSKGVM